MRWGLSYRLSARMNGWWVLGKIPQGPTRKEISETPQPAMQVLLLLFRPKTVSPGQLVAKKIDVSLKVGEEKSETGKESSTAFD